MSSNPKKKEVSVREAGRKGGQSTAARHGYQFYHQIGVKGGNRVRELIRRGKTMPEQEKKNKLVEDTLSAMEEADRNID